MWYERKTVWLLLLLFVICFSVWSFLSNNPLENSNVSRETSVYDYRGLLTKLVIGSPKCRSDCDRVFRDVFNTLTSSYRHCLLESLQGKSVWTHLQGVIKTCLGDALWRLLDVKLFDNRDDTKLGILPPPNIPAVGAFANCTEVTLGIGRDIEAELLLRKAQPHCKFYGADPIKISGTVFRELGPYFELAVSAQAGYITASVLEYGDYHDKNVSTVTLVDFLTQYINTTTVDYLLMDNEGAEYRLFPQLLRGGPIEANNISICQLSVEMHKGKQYGSDDAKYSRMILDSIANSSFLPIWSEDHTHIRSFYVNVADPYCVGKYFRSKWCGDFQYYR